MKKQFKKLTAVLLTAVMLLGMFTTMPVSVFAADVDDNSVGASFISSDGNYEYVKYDDGTIGITGYHGHYYDETRDPIDKGYLSIPDSIDGYEVTRIIDCAFMSSRFISISIPDTVTYVGGYAFNSCDNISVGRNLKSIGSFAFAGCKNLSINLSEDLQFLGEYAFAYSTLCDSYIYIPGTLEEIPEGLFKECKNLSYVKIGEGVKTIESDAFSGIEDLTVRIPDSVTDITGAMYCGTIECNAGSAAYKLASACRSRYVILNPILGDVDIDGEVNIKDATRLQMVLTFGDEVWYKGRYLCYSYSNMWNFSSVADVNRDRTINIQDATLIQKNIAKYDN